MLEGRTCLERRGSLPSSCAPVRLPPRRPAPAWSPTRARPEVEEERRRRRGAREGQRHRRLEAAEGRHRGPALGAQGVPRLHRGARCPLPRRRPGLRGRGLRHRAQGAQRAGLREPAPPQGEGRPAQGRPLRAGAQGLPRGLPDALVARRLARGRGQEDARRPRWRRPPPAASSTARRSSSALKAVDAASRRRREEGRAGEARGRRRHPGHLPLHRRGLARRARDAPRVAAAHLQDGARLLPPARLEEPRRDPEDAAAERARLALRARRQGAARAHLAPRRREAQGARRGAAAVRQVQGARRGGAARPAARAQGQRHRAGGEGLPGRREHRRPAGRAARLRRRRHRRGGAAVRRRLQARRAGRRGAAGAADLALPRRGAHRRSARTSSAPW